LTVNRAHKQIWSSIGGDQARPTRLVQRQLCNETKISGKIALSL